MKYCPKCIRTNNHNKLVLRQINLNLAVYLCEDKNCTYPEGYEVVQVEQRSLKELSNANKKQQSQKTDLDSWLDDFFTKEDITVNAQTVHDDSVNDDDLSNIIKEISECGNENNLDLLNESDLLSWVNSAFDQCSLSGTTGNQESDNLNNEITPQNEEVLNKEKVDNVNITNTAINTASSEKCIGDKQNNVKTTKYHVLNFELFKNKTKKIN